MGIFRRPRRGTRRAPSARSPGVPAARTARGHEPAAGAACKADAFACETLLDRVADARAALARQGETPTAPGETPDRAAAYTDPAPPSGGGRSPEELDADLLRRLVDEARQPMLEDEPLLRLLFEGICIYGQTFDGKWVDPLQALYRRALTHSSPAERIRMYLGVRKLLLEGRVAMNAMLPFMLSEDDTSIVAGATMDFATASDGTSGDPLAWARDLVTCIAKRLPANRGAVFGALVSLGDEWIVQLIDDVKRSLDLHELHTATLCTTGSPSLAAVEFWLAWLEELACEDRTDTAEFGECAAGLVRLARSSRDGNFAHVRRDLGPRRQGRDAPSLSVRATFTAIEIGALFADRMAALAEREAGFKVMQIVIAAFGPGPVPAAPSGRRLH